MKKYSTSKQKWVIVNANYCNCEILLCLIDKWLNYLKKKNCTSFLRGFYFLHGKSWMFYVHMDVYFVVMHFVKSNYQSVSDYLCNIYLFIFLRNVIQFHFLWVDISLPFWELINLQAQWFCKQATIHSISVDQIGY